MNRLTSALLGAALALTVVTSTNALPMGFGSSGLVTEDTPHYLAVNWTPEACSMMQVNGDWVPWETGDPNAGVLNVKINGISDEIFDFATGLMVFNQKCSDS